MRNSPENYWKKRSVKRQWYGIQSIVRWVKKGTKSTKAFEERIVLVKAFSFEDVLIRGAKELKKYCGDDRTLENTTYMCAYWIGDEEMVEFTEVFSSISATKLSTRQYMKRYHPKSHEKPLA